SPLSQIGPTTSYVGVAEVTGRGLTASTLCQASYSVGRSRSFIAASTMAKLRASECLRYCTSVSSTPALPTRDRPGSSTSSRSEEHTSELQSRENLVCRLLLEKKN